MTREFASRRTFLKTAGLTAAAVFARPVPAQEPSEAAAQGPRIAAGPYLQNVSPDAATIMWITDKPCLSWVDYGPTPELGNRIQNSRHGLVDACDLIHRIQLTGLTPGQPYYYRVASREIARFEPYQVDFGGQVQDAVRQFTPPPADASRVEFVVCNDVHGNAETWARLHALAAQKPFDFLVANGDLLDHIQEHGQVTSLFIEPCSKPLEGARPFVFVRGNHEARGQHARHLLDYVDTPAGGYYYAFTRGPVHVLVLDSGEDKKDESGEYFGLVNFKPYLEKEAEWVAEQVKSAAFRQAAFRIVLSHIPLAASGGGNDYRAPIVAALNGAGIDLAISGHTHTFAYNGPEAGRDYPIAIGGANDPANATLIRVEADRATMRMHMALADGTALESREYAAKGA
ncbi:MAG TPA: FN3 domain-containing metallophosphoesterase family protein [Candidatus Hydrogenedentes bacterium]|nr:FN3 domain-containing metallophosphoesterase family protein [Candidatus Hydrogenedentota bacterium]HQM49907.1 FN3 domain-containing metallophosphoesterase family protein [Candidatus Hydrogenedentota bacterium]